MPSVSRKQAKTMQAAAHNPKFAKKLGIPSAVAKEYNKKDRRRARRSGTFADVLLGKYRRAY